MTFASAIVVVLIIGLFIALCIALLESSGGYIGDSSMVPGFLLLVAGVIGAIAAMAIATGSWTVTFS